MSTTLSGAACRKPTSLTNAPATSAATSTTSSTSPTSPFFFTSNGVDQCHDEIFAGNGHLGMFNGNVQFSLTDWFGTERVRNYNGSYVETCTGLPFVDGLSCSQTDPDNPGRSPLRFTGKERDLETATNFGGANGLDYFGARYNSSRMGRFKLPLPTVGRCRRRQEAVAVVFHWPRASRAEKMHANGRLTPRDGVQLRTSLARAFS